MLGAGWTYSEYSAGQNEGPETVSGLFAFIPPPKGSGCSRSGYKASRLDAGLEAALQSMLKRAIAENKLSNQVAVKLLQELALLID